MKAFLIDAKINDFFITNDGKIFQVVELEENTLTILHISNNKWTILSRITTLMEEKVDIYKLCPVCCGDGDSKDVDCPTCDNVGFFWD